MNEDGGNSMAQLTNDPSSDIGPRGLVIYRKQAEHSDTFAFVNESTWRKVSSYAAQEQEGRLKALSTLDVALARIDGSVFVDLDQLRPGLELTEEGALAEHSPATEPGSIPPEKLVGENVILKEFGKLYVVPSELWSTANVAISGDAAVLINRDAVLAPIPRSPIAEGTFCVLINLAALA
jgi:hypothetical protein